MKTRANKIDWEKARAQLSGSGKALENALEASPERVAEILRQRARHLAARRRGSSPGKGSLGLQVQTFMLGGQCYGIGLDALLRIVSLGACTPVPGASPEVLGLVNLQGDIVVVFEPARLLGLDAEPGGISGYLLLLKNGGQPFGLRVREPGPVLSISPEDLEEGGALGNFAGDCGKGITKDRMVVLDEEKIGKKIRPDQHTNE